MKLSAKTNYYLWQLNWDSSGQSIRCKNSWKRFFDKLPGYEKDKRMKEARELSQL
jgi:hypothetical protein